MAELTDAQLFAVKLFARDNGRNWKAALRTVWQGGRHSRPYLLEDAVALQSIRNEFGPAWLTRFKLPKE